MSEQIVTFPVSAPSELVQLCQDWHSGQASAMYSVASTQTVHDYDTLFALSCELGRDARHCSNLAEQQWLEYWESWCDEILSKIPEE